MIRYLEPRTDVPAKDDWSTRLALVGIRIGLEDRVRVLITAVLFVVTFAVPATSGNFVARVVLGVSLVMYVPMFLVNRGVKRAVRRGLLDQPWRRVPAADEREVFVCGPDAEGRALVRAPGWTSMRKVQGDAGEYPALDQVEPALDRPGDEKGIQDVLRLSRQLGPFRWVLMAISAGIFWLLVSTSLSPLAPTGLLAAALWLPGVLGVPAVVESGWRERALAKAVAGSEQWTPVPMTLFRWQRGYYVAGIADLPDGPALVRFPQPPPDLIANIAATEVMWIAGTHKGVLAVGVPGMNVLTFAVVRPGRADRRSDPMPWWRRYRQPDFSALPG
ncbi:hypothetical protein [Lentzea sp. NPDC051838]|uniref:hypothetical protein n=1 Tax=Lentzea sp. NPDC051838 TaxID=3154849 RepID=UPI00342AAA7F